MAELPDTLDYSDEDIDVDDGDDGSDDALMGPFTQELYKRVTDLYELSKHTRRIVNSKKEAQREFNHFFQILNQSNPPIDPMSAEGRAVIDNMRRAERTRIRHKNRLIENLDSITSLYAHGAGLLQEVRRIPKGIIPNWRKENFIESIESSLEELHKVIEVSRHLRSEAAISPRRRKHNIKDSFK
jgi:hypothetical protein